MLIKNKKTWKDLVDNKPAHAGTSRREFLAKGLATCALSVALPNIFITDFISRTARADGMVCPPPTLAPGAVAQFFANGGPTMGARFISDMQAAVMNATMASNYGISGQLMKLGPNMWIDKTSPFGLTLLQGPNGYTGGSAAWQANVLSKISAGGHLGPFNQDDGAGENTGLLGGVSPFKQSKMGKDLKIGVSNTLATWANGLPAASVSSGGLQPSSLAKTFSLTPPAAGLITSNALSAANSAAAAIAQALAPVFGTATRKDGSQLLQNAGCSVNNNVAMADPNYGTTLFTPTGISALTSKMAVGNLSNEEQAQLAAFYQSAVGVAGGVIIEFGGRDYHGQSPQNTIAPADIEEARALVMFLAACDAAQTRGSLIYLANGQAIAKGVQSVTANVGGQNVTVNAPVATGDAGGAYNAGLIVFYDPKGALPATKFTGNLNTTDGSVKSQAGSSQEAVAGLYLSALKFINNGSIPQSALTAMNAAGVAGTAAIATTVVI